jgi:hypothetical protein
MNMPGFSAEASLYNVNRRYQATIAAPHHDSVEPARSLSEWASDENLRCWRFGSKCFFLNPIRPWECTWIWGVWWVC